MSLLDRPTTTPDSTIDRAEAAVRAALAGPQRPPSAISARIDATMASMTGRAADAAWGILHVLGAHRWREGYETDLERGWRRYRGSRCVICDEPWEGW